MSGIKAVLGHIFLIIFLTGCSATTPVDRSALLDARPRSIVVIPPMNNTVEVNASYTFLSTISEPLAEKGYYVFPVAVIDLFMKEQGLPTPAEMNGAPLDKIREYIGADAVLYTVIHEWGQKYQVVSSRAVVSADLKLVDTRDGQTLWQGRAYAEQSNSNSSNDFGAALLGAIVDQIAGSLVDNTYALSRQANSTLIQSSDRGLINGPYRPPEEN